VTITQSPVQQDVGLGTAYERWAIYKRLEKLCDALNIKRALEGPWDGMAGIPGVHLLVQAHHGLDVLAVHQNKEGTEQIQKIYAAHGLSQRLECALADTPPEDCGVDLVLSFNALPLVEDWRSYIEALFATGATYLFLAVTNPKSYGVFLRRALRIMERSSEGIELFDHDSTHYQTLKEELEARGRILHHEYLDCPWWPDLFVPTGEQLWSGTLKRFGYGGESTGRAPFTYGLEDFPYRGRPDTQELVRAMGKHPSFDGAPGVLPRFFGHHQLFVVEARG